MHRKDYRATLVVMLGLALAIGTGFLRQAVLAFELGAGKVNRTGPPAHALEADRSYYAAAAGGITRRQLDDGIIHTPSIIVHHILH